MLKRLAGWILLLLSALLLGMLVQGSAASALPPAPIDETRITLQPPAAPLSTGDTLVCEVWVENVTGLYGADIRLQFDPAAFQVQDANLALPGVQITTRYDLLQPGIVLYRIADNTAGTIWYVNSQINPAPPVSGSGALFQFELLALKDGNYPVIFTTVLLGDINGEAIAASAQGAPYTVADNHLFLPMIR